MAGRSYLIFGDIEEKLGRAFRRMHQMHPQRPLQRPQADQEVRAQGKHDGVEGTTQRRLPEARCTQHVRPLRSDLPRSAEGLMSCYGYVAWILQTGGSAATSAYNMERMVHCLEAAPSNSSSPPQSGATPEYAEYG